MDKVISSTESPGLSGRQRAFRQTHLYVITFLTATLTATILLKIGSIQYLELIYFADLLLLAIFLLQDRLRFPMMRPLLRIFLHYAIFLVAACLLGVIALRQEFSAEAPGLMKQPFIATLSRSAELAIDVFYMIYLGEHFARQPRLLRFGMKTYFWTGITSILYSFASLPLYWAHTAELGAYGKYGMRLRGFMNEGGPFGVYLIGVFLCMLYLLRQRWISRKVFWLSLPLLVIAAYLSASKSALALLLVLLCVPLFARLRFSVQLGLLATGVLLVSFTAFLFRSTIDYYLDLGARQYSVLSQLRPDDYNIISGRFAGFVLAPRMIGAHPLTGIGWGNFILVRNNPEYRRGTPISSLEFDSPGLGFADYVVDLGIPLSLFLLICELQPYVQLKRLNARHLPLMLATFQPLSTIFGAHLNITHPWFISAIALGAGIGTSNRSGAITSQAGTSE